MPSTEPPVGTYLAAVLRDGVAPFRYRSVARRLLGVSGDGDGIRPAGPTWLFDFPHERRPGTIPTLDAGPRAVPGEAGSRATVPPRAGVDAWDVAVPDPAARPPATIPGRHDSPATARATVSSGPGRAPAGTTGAPGSDTSRPPARATAPAAEAPPERPGEPPAPNGPPTRGRPGATGTAPATARPADLPPPQAARLLLADTPSGAATAVDTRSTAARRSSVPTPPPAAGDVLHEHAGRVVSEPAETATAVAPVRQERAGALQQLGQLSQAVHGRSGGRAPEPPPPSPPPAPPAPAQTPTSPAPRVVRVATGRTRTPAAYRARLHLGRIGLRGPR